MKALHRVGKNSALLFAARVIDSFAGLVLIALLTRFLGYERFGRYAWILALVTLFQPLVNFELDKILIREVASDKNKYATYTGNVLMIKWCFMLVVFSLLALFVHASELPSMVKYAIYIIILSETFYHHAMICLAVFNAFEKMAFDTLLTLIYRTASLALIGLVIVLQLHYIYVFVVLALSNLLRAATGLLLVVRKYGKPLFVPDFSLWHYLIGQAYFITISSFIAVGMFRVDIFLLALKQLGGSDSAVALFQVPHSLILQLQIVPFAFGFALFPLMSRFGKGDRQGLLHLYRDTFRLLFLVSVPITFLLIFFAPLITRLMYPEVMKEAVLALQIMAFCVIPLFFVALFSNILIAMEKQKFVLLGSVLGFLMNVVIDILLIPVWGPVGAALGKVIAYTAMSASLYYYVSRQLGAIHLLACTLKPLMAGLAACATFYLTRRYNLYVAGIAGCLVFFFFLYILRAVTQRDKEVILALLGKETPRLTDYDNVS